MVSHPEFDNLNIDDPEEVRERYEELAFEVRNHFLRSPVIASVFRRKVLRLRELWDIALQLTGEEPSTRKGIKVPDLPPTSDLAEMDKRNSQLKLLVSTTLHPDELGVLAEQMITGEEYYEQAMLERFGWFVEDPLKFAEYYDPAVKLSAPADRYELRKIMLQLPGRPDAPPDEGYRKVLTEVYRIIKLQKLSASRP